ncbi:MAG TPA: hypothetical protein VN654_17680 [Vicinamibacterales bacterium]|jgi:hypothetical protein|nr:hypothetical protein [Vicinamibacterales bacterium]
MPPRPDPRKVLKTIQAATKKLDAKRINKATGYYDKADEREIRAALKNLKKNIDDLQMPYFAWFFPGPK